MVRILLLVLALMAAHIVGFRSMVQALPGEETVTRALSLLAVTLVFVHAPLFLGWSVPSVVVRGIDYVWIGLSAMSATFAYMSYQGAALEREHAAAVQSATSLLDAIDAQMVKIETVCTTRALSLIRDPSIVPYNDDNCRVEWWISEEIAKKRADDHYPLSVSDSPGSIRQSNFDKALLHEESLAYLQQLESTMKWPLIKQMRRFGETTKQGLKAQWDKTILDHSIFNQPKQWIYLFVIAVAVRISKTSYEIAADDKAASTIKEPWRLLIGWLRKRFPWLLS